MTIAYEFAKPNTYKTIIDITPKKVIIGPNASIKRKWEEQPIQRYHI